MKAFNPPRVSAMIPRGTDEAKVIQVIETRSLIGAGLNGNPLRQIIQYWDFEGKLLASQDSLSNYEFYDPMEGVKGLEADEWDILNEYREIKQGKENLKRLASSPPEDEKSCTSHELDLKISQDTP